MKRKKNGKYIGIHFRPYDEKLIRIFINSLHTVQSVFSIDPISQRPLTVEGLELPN